MTGKFVVTMRITKECGNNFNLVNSLGEIQHALNNLNNTLSYGHIIELIKAEVKEESEKV